MPDATPGNARPSSDAPWRGAGVLLIGVSVLEVAAMAHHPSVHAHEIAEVLAQIRALATVDSWVHGVLIALIVVGFLALTEFARRRGLARPLIRAGLIAYAVGVGAMIGAALVDGFIVPDVAMRAAGVSAAELQISAGQLALCVLANQALARLGAVALSVGIAFWSLDLVRGAGLARVLGIAGIVIGLACAGALILGALHLNVHGMMLVLVLQVVWTVGVGILMLRAERA